MNNLTEVQRRIKIAERHLMETQQAFKRDDWPETVHHAQLCVENSAKAIISFFKIPSWSHDPGEELEASITKIKIPKSLEIELRNLVSYCHEMAPEHAKTNYGTITQLPEELYTKSEARRALKMAKDSLKTAKDFSKFWLKNRKT
ncbi:MAG: HEPN domain-containing protein [Candidatus Edwardsbacteria bacterium]